ncbi:MAG: DUF4132 domain-containing protein [Microscillaceae bacterium]|nr:DUF4132 domain-containing protein [Microscillaceae bacterium]
MIEKTKAQSQLYRGYWATLEGGTAHALLGLLLRSKIKASEDDWQNIFARVCTPEGQVQYWFPILLYLGQLEHHVQANGLSDTLAVFLDTLLHQAFNSQADKVYLKIREMLARGEGRALGEIEPVLLDEGDALGALINQDLAHAAPNLRLPFYQLLALCKKTNGGKPTAKFMRESQALLAQIGKDAFGAQMKAWLRFLKTFSYSKQSNTYSYNGREHTYDTYQYLQSSNQIALKGLVWAASTELDEEMQVLVAEFVEKCYQKIPGQGPMAAGIGNAGIYALAQAGLPGIAQLSRLKLRLRQASTRDLIEKYIREASAIHGISPAEIEEMATPDFGLVQGQVIYEWEGYRAVLAIKSLQKTELQWLRPDGQPQKTEPVFMKQNHPEDLKTLKETARQIPKMLTAQRDRLDRNLVADRTWSYAAFQKYYFEHGLMHFLTTRLIWVFEIGGKAYEGFYLHQTWVNAREEALPPVEQAQSVRLWHPVAYSPAQIQDWRNFMNRHEIQQALKQAFREIYLLTEAEINTRYYSNRMAAHILKQHQFNALAKIRGWKYSLLGAYDKGYESETATLALPENWRAEFWVQEVNANDAFNDTGIWDYVSTDQLRFYQGGQQMEMTQVPALIFSEVMRDVDLFVGVASVGNDPNWRDGGLQQYRNYWEAYSFGELGEMAKTRRQVLERLLPRLKFAKVAHLSDKFLVVKGQIRTYKIHLGSGNILMEPNDQYLCIVPDNKATHSEKQVFLPFEGDRTLSIILSKAFLLAEDTKISDSTITSQLKRGM